MKKEPAIMLPEPISHDCQFSSVALATRESEEGALLLLAHGRLVAVLAPVSPDHNDDFSVKPGWYLMAGFGPCEREGLFFATTREAENWARETVETAWGMSSAISETHAAIGRSSNLASVTP